MISDVFFPVLRDMLRQRQEADITWAHAPSINSISTIEREKNNCHSTEIFLSPIKTRAQRQGEALKRFMTAIDAIDDETFIDEDYAELENNRANFYREIEL